jgi:hypothetical protein
LLLIYPYRKKYWDQEHSFRWILKCQRNNLWVKTESLFLKYVSTAKPWCSTDQRSVVTQMLWVSLEERSRTNSPRQRFHSQLFCKIVRHFCRTLYKAIVNKSLWSELIPLTFVMAYYLMLPHRTCHMLAG